MTTAAYDVPASVVPYLGAADVAEYDRVSRDRAGAGLAVDRQHDAITEANGEAPARRYTDNDLSAYSGKPRPDYLRLLDDIRAGLIRILWVWHTDRLHRSNRELEEFISIVEAAEREHGIRVEIRSVIGSPIDLNTAAGRANARFLATVATLESDLKSERIRAKMAQKRAKGEAMGGRRRWGYTTDMQIDIAEAAIIRGIAADIIAGRRLHNIAKELNDKGIPSPTGQIGAWRGGNLGAMIRRPHIAGWQVHRGQVVGRGNWEPVLDPGTWEAVKAVLDNPSRATNPAAAGGEIGGYTSPARKWLLSGIARCGVCDQPLRAKKSVPGSKHERAYGCKEFHVTRPMPYVDAVVIGEAIGRLSDPGFAAAFLPPEDTDRAAIDVRIEALESRLEDVESERVLGLTTPRAAAKAKTAGMAELARLRGLASAMAARATLPAVFDGLAGNPDAAAEWDGLDLDRRRAVIDALMIVHVDPAARRGARFDPESVRITWRTESDTA